MTIANVEIEVVSALVFKSMCLFPKMKNSLLFPEWPFYFLKLLFYFPEVPFCFPEVSFYLMCVCVFQMLFPSWLYFLLVLLRAAQRDVICLALKTSTWCMISYIFYSSLILHDSLENAVFEHLKWLKLLSWKHLVPFLNVSDHVLVSKVAPDISKCVFTIIDFLDIVLFKNNFHA